MPRSRNCNQLRRKKTLNVLHRALDRDIRLSTLSFEYQPPAPPSSPGQGGAAAVPPAQPGAAANKADIGLIKIVFRFTIAGGVPLEQKVKRAEEVVETMKRNFAGYQVRLVSQFGNLSRTGSFQGEVGDVEGASAGIPDTSAEIELKGAPL